MRIRSIRPEFWTSEDIVSLSIPHRLVFIGLWSYVDDNGVGRDVEPLIRSDLFPLEPDQAGALKLIHGALSECSSRGMLTRYTVDGKPFLHITNFSTHQVINRPSRGRYPLPTCGNADTHVALSEDSVSPHAKEVIGEGEKGRRGEEEKVRVTRKRATAIPGDWSPNDTHKKTAHGRGIDVGVEAEMFRNWALASDKRYVNWDLTFQNWVLRARVTSTNAIQARTGSTVWDRPVRREDQP